jgi:hypothetical protein
MSLEHENHSEREEREMKKKLWIVLASLMMLAVVVIPVSARTNWTAFDGTLTKVSDLPGGNEWYSKDFTMVFCRNLRERYTMDVDDTRLDGIYDLTFSANFHITDPPAIVYGPIWGNIHLSNDGGYWVGRIAGSRTEQGYNYLFGVLHGHGGYEGMLAHVYYSRETTGLYDVITVRGYIK